MRKPMPSPKGTNAAKLFLPGSFPNVSGPVAAYDAAPEEGDMTDFILFLKSKLNEADFQRACELGKLDSSVTMDTDPDNPENGVDKFAQDARNRASFAKRYPHASTIKVTR